MAYLLIIASANGLTGETQMMTKMYCLMAAVVALIPVVMITLQQAAQIVG